MLSVLHSQYHAYCYPGNFMSQGVLMNVRSPTSGEFDHDTEIYLKIAIEYVVCKKYAKRRFVQAYI